MLAARPSAPCPSITRYSRDFTLLCGGRKPAVYSTVTSSASSAASCSRAGGLALKERSPFCAAVCLRPVLLPAALVSWRFSRGVPAEVERLQLHLRMAEGSQPCSQQGQRQPRAMHPFHRQHTPAPCSAVQRSRLLRTAHEKQRRSALDSGAHNSARRSGTARSRRTEVRKPRAAAYIKRA